MAPQGVAVCFQLCRRKFLNVAISILVIAPATMPATIVLERRGERGRVLWAQGFSLTVIFC